MFLELSSITSFTQVPASTHLYSIQSSLAFARNKSFFSSPSFLHLSFLLIRIELCYIKSFSIAPFLYPIWQFRKIITAICEKTEIHPQSIIIFLECALWIQTVQGTHMTSFCDSSYYVESVTNKLLVASSIESIIVQQVFSNRNIDASFLNHQ